MALSSRVGPAETLRGPCGGPRNTNVERDLARRYRLSAGRPPIRPHSGPPPALGRHLLPATAALRPSRVATYNRLPPGCTTRWCDVAGSPSESVDARLARLNR